MRFVHIRWGLQMCQWPPISLIWNLFSQNQQEIASTGKQIVMVGRPEVLSQSRPSFRCRLSVVYQKSSNVSEQHCNVYWSEVWIQLTPKLMCAIYSTTIPFKKSFSLAAFHYFSYSHTPVWRVQKNSYANIHSAWCPPLLSFTLSLIQGCSGTGKLKLNTMKERWNWICECHVFLNDAS